MIFLIAEKKRFLINFDSKMTVSIFECLVTTCACKKKWAKKLDSLYIFFFFNNYDIIDCHFGCSYCNHRNKKKIRIDFIYLFIYDKNRVHYEILMVKS